MWTRKILKKCGGMCLTYLLLGIEEHDSYEAAVAGMPASTHQKMEERSNKNGTLDWNTS